VEVTLQNADFRYIFSRPSGTSLDPKQPSILSTTIDSKTPVYNKKIIIKNVNLTDVSYERGSSFFELSADEIEIDSLRATNIGYFNLM
jgi:hypothetical protein